MNTASTRARAMAMPVILAISVAHFINDIMQSLVTALYPTIKAAYHLSFWEIGLMTLAFQAASSLFQPLVGMIADKRPMPYSLPVGMTSTILGLAILSIANSHSVLMAAAVMIGLGSAIFHPEASRVARMASGGNFGFAQGLFQVGGNFGQAIGPLAAAFLIVPRGMGSVGYLVALAAVGTAILSWIARWYKMQVREANGPRARVATHNLSKGTVGMALAILTLLTLSKQIYMTSINAFYTFFVIERFGLDVQQAQIMLFVFLGAAAAGTVLGGPIGDRYGSKTVIWFSILGALPFTLALPYVNLPLAVIFSMLIGFILASSFTAILVMAQELVPGRVGMVAGVFFGLAFGVGGIAAAIIGIFADNHGIVPIFVFCSYLPILGVLTIFLPNAVSGRAQV